MNRRWAVVVLLLQLSSTQLFPEEYKTSAIDPQEGFLHHDSAAWSCSITACCSAFCSSNL
jgi:hypothetical protein